GQYRRPPLPGGRRGRASDLSEFYLQSKSRRREVDVPGFFPAPATDRLQGIRHWTGLQTRRNSRDRVVPAWQLCACLGRGLLSTGPPRAQSRGEDHGIAFLLHYAPLGSHGIDQWLVDPIEVQY